MTAVTRFATTASTLGRAVVRLRQLDAWCGWPLWAGSNLEWLEADHLRRLTTEPAIGPPLEAALQTPPRRDEAHRPRSPHWTAGLDPEAAPRPGTTGWEWPSPGRPGVPRWPERPRAPRPPRQVPRAAAGEGEASSRRPGGLTGFTPAEDRDRRRARGPSRHPWPAHWPGTADAPGRQRPPNGRTRDNWSERLSAAARTGATVPVRPPRPGGRFDGRWLPGGPPEAWPSRADSGDRRRLSDQATPGTGPGADTAGETRPPVSQPHQPHQPHQLQLLVDALGSRPAPRSAGAPSAWEPRGPVVPHRASWLAADRASAHGLAPGESPTPPGRPTAGGGGGPYDPPVSPNGAAAQPTATGGWLTLGELGPALEQLLRDEARRYGIEPRDG